MQYRVKSGGYIRTHSVLYSSDGVNWNTHSVHSDRREALAERYLIKQIHDLMPEE